MSDNILDRDARGAPDQALDLRLRISRGCLKNRHRFILALVCRRKQPVRFGCGASQPLVDGSATLLREERTTFARCELFAF
jgi:hypothetical protein